MTPELAKAVESYGLALRTARSVFREYCELVDKRADTTDVESRRRVWTDAAARAHARLVELLEARSPTG